MKMKKLLALICASILSIGALTACSSGEETTEQTETATPAETEESTEAPAEEATGLQDGTYRAEYDKEDAYGWKAYVEITVADGKMTAVDFDYVNADGAVKSEDEAYNADMKAGSGVGPAEFTVALEESLLASQDPSQVDAVTGATSSSDEFINFTTALMEQMQAGNTDVLVIEAPAAE